MPEYERSVTIGADVQRAYQFLANPQNLPKYVATMVMARPEQGDHLRVAADVEGRHEEGDATFRTDPSSHSIRWGGGAGSDYSGSLRVTPAPQGSMVQLRLHVPEAHDQGEINRVIDETMENIKRELAS